MKALIDFFLAIDPKYFPLIAPCITACATVTTACVAFFGFYLTHKYTQNRSDRDYRLRKLEELFALTQTTTDTLTKEARQFLRRTSADVSDTAAIQERNSELKRQLEEAKGRMTMLIDLYFTRLFLEYQSFQTAADLLSICLLSNHHAINRDVERYASDFIDAASTYRGILMKHSERVISAHRN